MRTTLAAAFVMAASVASCKPRAVPTPSGTVLLDWKDTATTLANGLTIGPVVGAPVNETKTVEFTPDDEVRDKSLKAARLELTIEREDVGIVANAKGERPAELAARPTHATVKVIDAGGWRFDKASCDAPSWPTDIGERTHRVGIFLSCTLPMTGGREDMGSVMLTIAGNGKHTAGGAFGKATLR